MHNCVIGCNSFVGPGCRLTNCLLMGNDNYTNKRYIEQALKKDKLIIGIGEGPPTARHPGTLDACADQGPGCSGLRLLPGRRPQRPCASGSPRML